MMQKVNFSYFREKDDVASFAAAMKYLRENPGTELTIEPGEYILTSEMAREAQKSVMSGEWGENPQWKMFNPKYLYTRGISMDGQRGSRINAYGVKLVVDGFMEPLSIIDCEDIEVCGITIDHKRKPFSKGRVESVSLQDAKGQCTCVVALDEGCTVEQGTPINLRHRFYDERQDCIVPVDVICAKFLDAEHIKLDVVYSDKLKEGLSFYTIHTYHSRPAILIERAKNICLKDVVIHSQPGMGIVGNRSEEVMLSGVKIIPAAGYRWSTNTDATHFTSMKGLLRYENCRFEGQGDDSANVHTYYQDIIKREGEDVCWMQEKTPDGTHAQSLDYPDVGDVLELTERDTLLTKDKYIVEDVFTDQENWCTKVKLDHALPENTEGYVLADITRLPRLEMVGCYAEKHFARGFLIKSRNVLVEENTFRDIPLAGIEVAAESHWYEGVTPSNVIIRRNRIINCGGGILVKADTKNPMGQSLSEITIEDNIIDCPEAECGIFAANVDTLSIERNNIRVKERCVQCVDCTNVVEEN